MENKNEQFFLLDTHSILVRTVLILAVIGITYVSWVGVRTQFGNLIAETTPISDSNAKANGMTAVYLSPNDPVANWLLANADKNPDLQRFEEVIRLAPNDFHYWIELGRNYEHISQPEKAEQAMKKSLELAPNYAYPLWTYGNFLLRQGRTPEAFQQLKRSAENSALYREQVFYTAWEVFDKDTAKLDEIAGETSGAKAYLAKFYTKQDLPDKALASWSSLNPEEKDQFKGIGENIRQGLFDRRNFRVALGFAQQLGTETDAKAEFITNGNFENPVGEDKTRLFDWKVLPLEKFDVKRDGSQKHDGKWSLRVGFNGFKGTSLANIYQLVAAQPSTRYRLTFWLRTSELKSNGLPYLEIIDAKGEKGIGATAPFPAGSNDWQEMKIDFNVSDDTDGFTIRTARAFCGENCPINGSIWYDDFKLNRIGK